MKLHGYRVWLLGHARSKKSKNYDKLEEIDGFGTSCYKCIIILPILYYYLDSVCNHDGLLWLNSSLINRSLEHWFLRKIRVTLGLFVAIVTQVTGTRRYRFIIYWYTRPLVWFTKLPGWHFHTQSFQGNIPMLPGIISY